jgi:glycosyltransferase involved in cell wall biosynthesis
MDTPVASVVICTRNRADSLERCLRSLESDDSTTPAEVIVVDNGSTDETPARIQAAAAMSRRRFVVLRETTLGSSSARNAGARAATGEFVLFADDDVVIHSGWIDALVAAFSSGVAAVGGRVLPQISGDTPPWFTTERNSLTLWDDGSAEFDMTTERHPLGANMAVRGEVIRGFAEPFPSRLGHVGGVRMAYEEVHLVAKMLQDHRRVVYAPKAVVDHVVDAERLTYEFTRRAHFHYGFGRARYQRMLAVPFPGLAARANLAVRSYRYALALRLRHSRARTPNLEDVDEEFMAYFAAGKNIEWLLGRWPHLAEWLARVLI